MPCMESTAEEAIELNGTVSKDEFLRFYRFQYLRDSGWLVLPVGLVLVWILVSEWYRVLEGQLDLRASQFLLTLVVLYAIYSIWVSPKRAVDEMFATSKAAGKPCWMRFDAEGFQSRCEGYESHIPWGLVHRVVETKSMFAIYISAASSILILKHNFESDQEVEDWKQSVNGWIAPKQIEAPGMLARRV